MCSIDIFAIFLTHLLCHHLRSFLNIMRLKLFAKADIMRPVLFVYVSFLSLTSVTAQYAADTHALIIKEIEHLYFDADPAGILSAVSPCSNYYDPSTGGSNSAVGRNTAAEWIRTAFRK